MQEKPFLPHAEKNTEMIQRNSITQRNFWNMDMCRKKICAARVSVNAFELFASLPASIWTSVDY